MTKKPITITKDVMLSEVLKILHNKKITNVFVIENRKPVQYHLGCINGTKVKNILRSIDYLVKKNYFRALNRLPCGMLRDETLIN